MIQAHLQALQKKREKLKAKIRDESLHAARDEVAIRRMKEQNLHLKEEMRRMYEDEHRQAG